VPKMKFRVAFPIQMTRARIVIEEAQKEYEVPDVKAFESVEDVSRYSATLFIDPHRRFVGREAGIIECDSEVIVGSAWTKSYKVFESATPIVGASKAFKLSGVSESAEVSPA